MVYHFQCWDVEKSRHEKDHYLCDVEKQILRTSTNEPDRLRGEIHAEEKDNLYD